MAQKKSKSNTPYIVKHRKIILIIGGILAGIVILMGLLYAFVFTPVKDPSYGTSFSTKRAKEFDLNWQENYLALLQDLGIKRFRLMSHWDLHENERGVFDFSDLDWQMDQAAQHGAKVSLAIGLRQPRWPECHEPGWAMLIEGHEYKQALYAYMEVVANRYKDHPALESWQLENEAVNGWFGECHPGDRQRLDEEFALLKKWDTKHPVIMSLSDQHGLPLGTPVPDIYAFSVYRLVYNTMGPQFYYVFPTPIWYHRIRAAVITLIHHKPIRIHELQMEPWGPLNTSELSIEEQNKSMSIEQIGKSFMFARRLGLREIDLWGSEWWYWRKVHGDFSVWETIRDELKKR